MRHLSDQDLDIIGIYLDEHILHRLDRIDRRLDKIEDALEDPLPPTPDVAAIRLLVQGAHVQLTDTQQVDYVIAEDDSAGAVIPKDIGTVVWSVDDPTIATVTPSADGFTGTVAAVTGANGTATVTATVTVTEPSDGSTKTFTGSDAVVVAVPQPDVASIVLTPGTPTAKP